MAEGKLYRPIAELVPAAFQTDFEKSVPLSAVVAVSFLNPDADSQANLCWWVDDGTGIWSHLGMLAAVENDVLGMLSTRESPSSE